MQPDVLVAIFVLIFTDITIHTAGMDVKQFFNQFEPIWTYRTTRRGHFRCEVDQVQSVRPLSITIKRCVFVRGSRCELAILGVLDRQRTERMTLLHRVTFKTVESLLFMAVDHSCAVIKVESLTEWHHEYYDLRLRNSSVHRRPHPTCRSFFKGVIGHQPSFFLYKRECQWLIRQ
ncbi:hypothetical protein MTO96_050452 [Rhipicephalus appendiculatus]